LIGVTIVTTPISIHDLFECFIVKGEFCNVQFASIAIEGCKAFVLNFPTTLIMERTLAKVHAKERTFRFIAEGT
jgi:hypothetical protein